ncbi:hypothetical protein OAH18_03615, partial [bacterium]|nr:hypothetical protein [bacterium]
MLTLFSDARCLRLVTALGHSLWQVTLIAIVAAILMRMIRQASLRYQLGIVAMALMLACPLATYSWLPGDSATQIQTDGISSEPGTVASHISDSHQTTQPQIAETANTESIRPTQDAPPQSSTANSASKLSRVAPYLFAIYCFGVALMLARLTLSIFGAQRIKWSAIAIQSTSIQQIVAEQARHIGVKVTPVVAETGRVVVPMVCGIIRPMILLPATLATSLSADQLEAVIAHEL